MSQNWAAGGSSDFTTALSPPPHTKEDGTVSALWYLLISSFIAARDSLTRIYGAGRWKLSIFLRDLANGLCAITSPGSRELSADVDWSLSFLSAELFAPSHCYDMVVEKINALFYATGAYVPNDPDARGPVRNTGRGSFSFPITVHAWSRDWCTLNADRSCLVIVNVNNNRRAFIIHNGYILHIMYNGVTCDQNMTN